MKIVLRRFGMAIALGLLASGVLAAGAKLYLFLSFGPTSDPLSRSITTWSAPPASAAATP